MRFSCEVSQLIRSDGLIDDDQKTKKREMSGEKSPSSLSRRLTNRVDGLQPALVNTLLTYRTPSCLPYKPTIFHSSRWL